MKAIILNAGVGSRLVTPHPKALTRLVNGQSILELQVENLMRYIDIDDIVVVVGFKKEVIMEAFPRLTYVYNDRFHTTNTSKSLLLSLKKLRGETVLQLNGDVVFDHRLLEKLLAHRGSSMAVNSQRLGEGEEVKYASDAAGNIAAVSKTVAPALGEALGINKFVENDVDAILAGLEACADTDYFERGVELAIEAGVIVRPIDVSNYMCTEIDFVEDLQLANRQMRSGTVQS